MRSHDLNQPAVQAELRKQPRGPLNSTLGRVMPMSFADFCQMLDKPTTSKSDLLTLLERCRERTDHEREREVLVRLESSWPGWDSPATRHGGSRETIAIFRERAAQHPSARAAYVWLLERFCEINPSLFEDVRWETTGFVAIGKRRGKDGPARNYFARSPQGLFLKSPNLAENRNNYRQLQNGWYINVNLSTPENFDILCRYAYVSDLRHPADWDWVVLDPSEGLADAKTRKEVGERILDDLCARAAANSSVNLTC